MDKTFIKYLAIPKALFADDLVIWTTDKKAILSKLKLNRALLTISTYCNLWKLEINPQKSVFTIFSHSPKAAKRPIQVMLNGEHLMKEDFPVYLGVQL
ncbi:MAG: hypothetical protein ACWIPJ_09835, partial [Polaribacter sp.]